MNLHYAGLGMDYMMSLATLAKGYSHDHVIDVVPVSYTHLDVYKRQV